MKEAQITVFDKQIYETHNEEAENRFVGNIAFKEDAIFITYKDPENNVTTVVKCRDNKVAVKRIGAIQGNLEFDTEKSHTTSYKTPYGIMDMEIQTNKIDTYFWEKGIKIFIEYKIIMHNQKVSDNIYMIVAN